MHLFPKFTGPGLLGSRVFAFSIGALLWAAAPSLQAQLAPPCVHANWKLAERFSPEALRPYLYSTSLTPGWINKSDTFWYSWRDQGGIKFWRVDSKAKKRAPLFDSARMAALLSEATKHAYDTTNLPITTVTFDEKNENLMRFMLDGNRYEYDLKADTLKNLGRPTPEQLAAEADAELAVAAVRSAFRAAASSRRETTPRTETRLYRPPRSECGRPLLGRRTPSGSMYRARTSGRSRICTS